MWLKQSSTHYVMEELIRLVCSLSFEIFVSQSFVRGRAFFAWRCSHILAVVRDIILFRIRSIYSMCSFRFFLRRNRNSKWHFDVVYSSLILLWRWTSPMIENSGRISHLRWRFLLSVSLLLLLSLFLFSW